MFTHSHNLFQRYRNDSYDFIVIMSFAFMFVLYTDTYTRVHAHTHTTLIDFHSIFVGSSLNTLHQMNEKALLKYRIQNECKSKFITFINSFFPHSNDQLVSNIECTCFELVCIDEHVNIYIHSRRKLHLFIH